MCSAYAISMPGTPIVFVDIYAVMPCDDAEDGDDIKIHKDKLIAYKATHPDESNCPAGYKVTIGGINVKVYVEFILPTDN